jgi:hypothetical protein
MKKFLSKIIKPVASKAIAAGLRAATDLLGDPRILAHVSDAAIEATTKAIADKTADTFAGSVASNTLAFFVAYAPITGDSYWPSGEMVRNMIDGIDTEDTAEGKTFSPFGL